MTEIPEFVTGFKEQIHEFVWKIPNCKEVTNSELIVSQQRFTIELGTCADVKSKWLVGFHVLPDKKFQLFMELLDVFPSSTKLMAKLKFGFIDGDTVHQNNWHFDTKQVNVNEKLFSNHIYAVKPGAITTDSEGTMWWKLQLILTFIKNPFDTKSEFSKDGFQHTSISELQKHFAGLLTDFSTHDLKIVCSDGSELGAHKNILAARNSVFATMLASDMLERNTGTLKVDDVSKEVMQILLHYFYTGELLSDWSKPENIVEFTYAAGKHQMSTILDMLDNFLGNEENSSCNVLLLSLAKKLSLKTAEAKLMERIVKLSCNAKSSDDLLKLFSSQD